MFNKKRLKWLLWCFLFVLFAKLYVSTEYTLKFIEQSVETNAKVLAVSKNTVGYNTLLKFVTKFDTVLNVEVLMLTEHKVGQVLPIFYNPIIPVQLSKNSFFEIWFSTFLTASLIIHLIIILYVTSIWSNWRKRRNQKLRYGGNHVFTDFVAVEVVTDIKKEGRHPYQIISSWHDNRKDKTYFFKSEYLWKNPLEFIFDKSIKVIIDNKNMKKYVMDLRFLPNDFI